MTDHPTTNTLAKVPKQPSSSSPFNSTSASNFAKPLPDHKLKQLWKDSGIDLQVIPNLICTSEIPDELSKQIIRSLLQANHLEIVVPPGVKVTNAVDAALISFVATSHNINKHRISSQPPATLPSPTVLVVCLTTKKVERHCKICQQLGKEVEGVELDLIHHSNSLSTELNELKSKDTSSINRPLFITALSRLILLFFEHQVISINRLSILVLDFRDNHKNSLNHHLLVELEPFLNKIKPQVQIVVLYNLDTRISPALSNFLSQKMESSIRANLSDHSSAPTNGDPTPSLSSSSLSPNPSSSLSTSTFIPPINILSPSVVNLPFNTLTKHHQTNLNLIDYRNS